MRFKFDVVLILLRFFGAAAPFHPFVVQSVVPCRASLILCGGLDTAPCRRMATYAPVARGPPPRCSPRAGPPPLPSFPAPLRYAPAATRPGFGESGRGQARVLFCRLRAAVSTASASFRLTYISHPPISDRLLCGARSLDVRVSISHRFTAPPRLRCVPRAR